MMARIQPQAETNALPAESPGTTLVVSLWQPWATLVVVGAKRIETRSWPTLHRGRLGIHATRFFPSWAREFAELPAVREAIHTHDPALAEQWGDPFPTGALLGLTSLTDCLSTNQVTDLGPRGRLPPFPGTFENLVGDYSADRFMWLLEAAERFAGPVPARGWQRLWHFRRPTGSAGPFGAAGVPCP